MTDTQHTDGEQNELSRDRAPGYWAKTDLSTRAKIKEFERTPLAERGLPTSVYDYIRAGAAIDPDAVAFTYFADAHDLETVQHITHREVLYRITQVANLLWSLKVEANDAVAILTASAPEPQFVLWAAQTVGIANPLNWMLEPELLGELITAAGAKVLVCYGGDATTDPWAKLEAVLGYAPAVEVVIRAGGSHSGARPSGVTCIDLLTVLDDFDGEILDHPRTISWDTVGAYIGTGGTTGAPKLARITHGGQIYASWASALSHQLPVGVSRMCASPMFHVHGIAVTQLTALALGGTAVFPTSGGWRGVGVVDNFWSIVEAFSVTSVPLLPTVANSIVQHPDKVPDKHTISRVSSGSAPLAAEVADRFRQLTGVGIVEGYGLTETSGAVVSCPRGVSPRAGVIGMPVPYTEAKVVRRDTSGEYVDTTTGEPGSLLLRCPSVFAGYVDPAQNTGVLLDDGWVDTGDLGSLDDEGFLRLTGRSKDVIIRGGHNIDPAPVEEALFTHPSVVEATVVGMPDPHAGEIPVAYVVAVGGEVDLDELGNHIRDRVRERAALPKYIFLVQALPKSAVGKVLKNSLRVDATERAVTRLLDDAGLRNNYTVAVHDGGAAGIHVVVTVPRSQTPARDLAKAALSSLAVPHRVVKG
ncbi:AMP-binding protein [Nocardia salmonicida]|uniref:AMP-binding protein n=1 Tax=Nocardia salmonicida TaxID=53431 RepID=UPI0036355B4F